MSKKNRGGSAAENSSAARRRRKKQKRQMRLYVISVIIVVFIIFVILVFNVFFNIQSVEVVGSTNYTSDQIFQASGITVGDNMLRENTDICSSNITSRLTYVESADVKKIYPGTIKITVEASIPFANVKTGGGYLLISQGGKILEKLINPKSGVMTITGADPDGTLEVGERLKSFDENKTEDIYALLEAFENVDYQMDNITSIDITDRSDVSFEYDSRIVVELGAVTDLDYKLKFSSEILTNQIGSGAFGVLRLLPDSAQFIDEAGLEENDRIFEQNMELYEQSLKESEAPVDGSETDTSAEDGSSTDESSTEETVTEETEAVVSME